MSIEKGIRQKKNSISGSNTKKGKLETVWSTKLSAHESQVCEWTIDFLKDGGILKQRATKSEFVRLAILHYRQQALDCKLKPQ